MSYLEISYISPTSDYNLKNPESEYKLVLLCKTVQMYANIIYEIKLTNIDNISREVRGFPVKKTIRISSLVPRFLDVKVFECNKKKKILKLLFSGNLDTTKKTHNVICDKTPKTLPVSNKTVINYMLEPFYDCALNKSKEGCLITGFSTNEPRTDIVDSKIIYSVKKGYLVNRYSASNLIEYYPRNHSLDTNSVSIFYKKNKNYNSQINQNYKDLNRLVNDFAININRFGDSSRPMYHEENRNNIVVAPSDSRVVMFDTKNWIKILQSMFNFSLVMKKDRTLDKEFINGSGFISRINPRDNRSIYMPYDAYISSIVKYKDTVILELNNDYFMAPSTLERDQFSVVYGKCLCDERGCDERLAEQPRITYRAYLVLIGSVHLNNPKLKIHKVWINKGEKLGYSDLDMANIIYLSNRSMLFNDLYNRKDVPITLPKIREHYIRARDFVGYIN